MNTQICVVWLMFWLRGLGVASFNLTISPEHVRVTEDAQSVTFTCSADVALAGCQVRWWDDDDKAGPLLELSRGPESQADPAHFFSSEDNFGFNKLTGYSYSGRSLWAGDCGVTLHLEGIIHWMVAFRVQPESGGWKYAWANFNSHIWAPLPTNLTTPKELIVLPGGEARILMKAGEPLGSCWFKLPSEPSSFNFEVGAGSADSTGRHLYLGAGVESGECGLALTNISEADNGPVELGIISPGADARYTALVVARPPTAPTLSLVYTGDNVTATCDVLESRPVANLTWFLGDAVIRDDDTDDTQATADAEWRWPWTTGSVSQTVSLQVQPQDLGKDLKCVVSHVALDKPLVASQPILYTGSTTTTTQITTASSPINTSSTTASTIPGPKCIASKYLDLLCREYRVRPSQHGNTSCPKDEVHEYRIRKAGAAARTAEIEEETAKTKLEAEMIATESAKEALESAKFNAKAEESRATAAQLKVDAARSHARAEDSWAQNAGEELKFERERRTKSLQHSQSPQSQQG